MLQAESPGRSRHISCLWSKSSQSVLATPQLLSAVGSTKLGALLKLQPWHFHSTVTCAAQRPEPSLAQCLPSSWEAEQASRMLQTGEWIIKCKGSVGLYSAFPGQLQWETSCWQQCRIDMHGVSIAAFTERQKGLGALFFPQAAFFWSATLWFTPSLIPSHCQPGAFSTAPLAQKSQAFSASHTLSIPSQSRLRASVPAGDTRVPFSRAFGKQPTP